MRTPATASVIAVEAAVAAVVVVVAAAGVSGPAWLLVAGLAGHGFKDLWQHRSHFVANTRWWPPFCLVVDWVVAAILVLLIAVGEESKGDQRAGHRPHVDSSAPGHLADVGTAGGLEHELLGGQGADERLLACLLLHADTPVAWRARWRLSPDRPAVGWHRVIPDWLVSLWDPDTTRSASATARPQQTAIRRPSWPQAATGRRPARLPHRHRLVQAMRTSACSPMPWRSGPAPCGPRSSSVHPTWPPWISCTSWARSPPPAATSVTACSASDRV
jgi:hypothetical protein